MSKEELKNIYDISVCLTEYKHMSIIERIELYCREEGIKLSSNDWKIINNLNTK